MLLTLYPDDGPRATAARGSRGSRPDLGLTHLDIQMALGASGRRVLGEVLRLGLMNALAGTVLGLAGAFGLARFIEGLVFGVSATDPATFAGVAGFILLVALAASCLPAWRAARIDPADALRAV